jgi:hypothetical protein
VLRDLVPARCQDFSAICCLSTHLHLTGPAYILTTHCPNMFSRHINLLHLIFEFSCFLSSLQDAMFFMPFSMIPTGSPIPPSLRTTVCNTIIHFLISSYHILP